MNKRIKQFFTLICFIVIVLNATAQDSTATQPAPPQKQEKAKSSTALWISLGVVFFSVFIALNAKKMKKKKE